MNNEELQHAIIVIVTFIIVQAIKWAKDKIPFLNRLDPQTIKFILTLLSVSVGGAIGTVSDVGSANGAIAGLGAIGVNEVLKKLGLSSRVDQN